MISTKNIERVLAYYEDQLAIAEYLALREVNHHLTTHLMASRAQAEASYLGVRSLLGGSEVEPDAGAQLLG